MSETQHLATSQDLKFDGVVVGIDGSDDSYRTTKWAAYWASKSKLPLLIVMVQPIPNMPRKSRTWDELHSKEFLERSHHSTQVKLDSAVEAAKSVAADLAIDKAMLHGNVAGTLVGFSATAKAVIVGSRGAGRVLLPNMGGVADEVVTNAVGNVIAVPAGFESSDGHIVVGIDDDPRALPTLRFAFEQARNLGRELVVVHAWYAPPAASEATGLVLADSAQITKECLELIDEYLSPLKPDFPDVKVTPRVYNANPADALIDESKKASLVVVSSRGRGGFAGLLLGSTSRTVVRASACPTAIVRARTKK